MTNPVELEFVAEIANDIGGGGDIQNVITLKCGCRIFIAYGQIGVYTPEQWEGNIVQGDGTPPLALWDYMGERIAAEKPLYNVVDFETRHTGGGVMVDFIGLYGLQELTAPSEVCLTITAECVVYRAMDDLALECPNPDCKGHEEPLGDVERQCPLEPFGAVYLPSHDTIRLNDVEQPVQQLGREHAAVPMERTSLEAQHDSQWWRLNSRDASGTSLQDDRGTLVAHVYHGRGAEVARVWNQTRSGVWLGQDDLQYLAELSAAWERQVAEQTEATGIGPMHHDFARLAGLVRRLQEAAR